MNQFQWLDFVKIDNNRHSRRASSTSPTGDNRDRLSIVRGTTETLLGVQEAGCINHRNLAAGTVAFMRQRKLISSFRGIIEQTVGPK